MLYEYKAKTYPYELYGDTKLGMYYLHFYTYTPIVYITPATGLPNLNLTY